MNVMTVDGFHAAIEFDADLDMFRGEIHGLNGGADFYGKRRHFSGKFNLRISPELHEKLAIAAQVQGKSINTLAQEALRDCVTS